MNANTDNAVDRSGVYTCLEKIRMSERERWHARESLRDGELVAELVLRAAADMAAIARGIAHAASALAGGVKALLAKPIKH